MTAFLSGKNFSTITSSDIADSAIVSSKIADDAVTTSKIATDAVTGDALLTSAVVAISPATDLTPIENRMAVDRLRSLIATNGAYIKSQDGVADEYADETGVDGTPSINQTYNSSGDYYSGLFFGNDANTKVLLHGEGSNNSTTITDSAAGGAFTWSVNGNAKVSTTRSKFGNASLLFDGNGDWVSSTNFNMSSIGTGDWTIECWLYPTAYDNGSSPRRGGVLAGSAGSANVWYINLGQGNIGFTVIQSGQVYGVGSTAGDIPLNTWTHYALVRHGNDYVQYANGTQIGTATDARNITVSSPTFVGYFLNNSGPQTPFYFPGSIDEVRISNIARYTSNFTPATVDFDTALALNVTIVSDTFTAQTAPTEASLVLLHQPIVACTLNVDTLAYISRDGGTTYTQGTLASGGEYSTGINILTINGLDISAQPSGTNMKYKIVTANVKEQRFHGAWLQWS